MAAKSAASTVGRQGESGRAPDQAHLGVPRCSCSSPSLAAVARKKSNNKGIGVILMCMYSYRYNMAAYSSHRIHHRTGFDPRRTRRNDLRRTHRS